MAFQTPSLIRLPSKSIVFLAGSIQRVTLGQLKKLGYRADVAPSGLAALEALDRTYYVTTV
jgi:hypothetical protein